MPFQLDEVVNDPDLAQTITVVRTSGEFAKGGWKSSERQFEAYGVLTVSKSKELVQVPQGDRTTGAIYFLSTTRLYTTSETGVQPGGQQSLVSDQIIWHGLRYRVEGVEPWLDFGFWSAELLRIAGN